ncbi:RimK/LysX family protein [Nostocoides sp. F2B08]|uniref:ATP-dependent zinc protease family protein n=1 Tax=Nostocoides sp. F2B08 TaxID=2653936 RepID=UPI001D055CE0|nr:RimK/LysX family protein [Tetrasphaera sp. F2B08]
MTAPSNVPTGATVVGWREWVRMSALGVPWVKAKVDTGAKTSSLHAFDLQEYVLDGERRVRFHIHPWQASDEDAVPVDLPVLDRRPVRSSSGHVEERYVVQLRMTLARRRITAEVTLTDRDEMGFRMLIGREALAQGFLVDARQSYAGPRPKRSTRRRNWGRA